MSLLIKGVRRIGNPYLSSQRNDVLVDKGAGGFWQFSLACAHHTKLLQKSWNQQLGACNTIDAGGCERPLRPG